MEKYRVFNAKDHQRFGYDGLVFLSQMLRQLDTDVWPPHQRAELGSIETRVQNHPETTFVLQRQRADGVWEIVGALFTRAIRWDNFFQAKRHNFLHGLTVHRVAWSQIENHGDVTPQEQADCLWIIGLFVRPGLSREASNFLSAALAGYLNRRHLKYIGGDSRIPGAKAYCERHPDRPLALNLVDYVHMKRPDGLPRDPILRIFIKGGCVYFRGRIWKQFVWVVGITLGYFDDPESMNAAALVRYEDPLAWVPDFLRPYSSRLIEWLFVKF